MIVREIARINNQNRTQRLSSFLSSNGPMSTLKSGPISVLWDIENVQIPGASAETASLSGSQIVLRMESALAELGLGPIHEFKAFLDIGKDVVKQEMRSELQCSNVMLVDATSVTQSKDLADKMLVVHMFSFALDHPPPATIVLISGDVDFAMPLAALRMRKYHIVLVLPLGRNVNPKLKHLAHTICYFNDILFPEKLYMPVVDADGWTPSNLDEADAVSDDNNSTLLNLLTPQHLLKSKTELRQDRPELYRLQRAADPEGHETANARVRRLALLKRNQAKPVACEHCGKTNHTSDRCFRRPRGSPSSAPRLRTNAKAVLAKKTPKAARAKALPKVSPSAPRAPAYQLRDDNDDGDDGDDDELAEHDAEHDDEHESDDELAGATLDEQSLWLHQLAQQQLHEQQRLFLRSKGVVADDSDHSDDGGELVSPQRFRDSSDNVSLLSENAVKVHLQDLIDVLVEIREGGEHMPLVSRVGIGLRKSYSFYRPGMARQLLNTARKDGLVRLHGHGPKGRVELLSATGTRAPQIVPAAPAPPAAPQSEAK